MIYVLTVVYKYILVMPKIIKNRLLIIKYFYRALISNNSLFMLYLKHLAGTIYRKRYFFSFFVLLFLTGSVFYLLLSWGVVCSNVEVWQLVHKVCHLYHDGESVGNLCPPLCEHGRIHSMNCQPLHAGKESVFSAELDGMPLVFKSSKHSSEPDIRSSVYWEDNKGNRQYPTEEEFRSMVATLIKSEMNVTATEEQLTKLTQLGPVPTRPEMRNAEMRDLWSLLQDHEYLGIRLFAEQEIFPSLIGSCGGLYAVEYAEPLVGGAIWEHEDEIWSDRLKVSVLVLELIERLESTPPVPLRVCDVHLGHFGKSTDESKVVILDGDSVVTQVVANNMAGDGQVCKKHTECRYLDCHAACENGRCQPPSTNNNIQSVCEKVFLGDKWAGALLVPGLLASPHTPPTLAALLRLCAHPHGEGGIKHGTPDDVRARLVDTVEEMMHELDLQAS